MRKASNVPMKAAPSPMAKPNAGFLINHNAFTDARPPGARGQRKSAGYPNYPVKGNKTGV